MDLNQASTVFAAQIIESGKTILCTDDKRRLEFEKKTLKMYAKLNEEREIAFKRIEESGSIYENDVVLNKVSIIERCLKRISEEYDNNPLNLLNFTKQDSIILNIQRACEAAIDLGIHVVAEKKLGIPQTSRETFHLLQKNDIITMDLCKGLKFMVGFRNIAVHDYQEVNK